MKPSITIYWQLKLCGFNRRNKTKWIAKAYFTNWKKEEQRTGFFEWDCSLFIFILSLFVITRSTAFPSYLLSFPSEFTARTENSSRVTISLYNFVRFYSLLSIWSLRYYQIAFSPLLSFISRRGLLRKRIMLLITLPFFSSSAHFVSYWYS